MGAGRKEVVKQTFTRTCGGTVLENSFVKLDSNSEVVQAGNGEEIFGVARKAGVAGDEIPIALQNAGNIVVVRSGAAVTNGAKVASDAAGKVVDSATTDIELGFALEASAAVDENVPVYLMRMGVTA